MTDCVCGHTKKRHSDEKGRCDDTCRDTASGQYPCVCPVYRPVDDYCSAHITQFAGWSRIQPRCALPTGHDGHHQTRYGVQFDNKGDMLR